MDRINLWWGSTNINRVSHLINRQSFGAVEVTTGTGSCTFNISASPDQYIVAGPREDGPRPLVCCT